VPVSTATKSKASKQQLSASVIRGRQLHPATPTAAATSSTAATAAPATASEPAVRRLVTDTQLAELTGIKRRTWQFYRMTGQGPKYFKIGKRVMYDPVAVDRWMALREFASTEDVKKASVA
jgi:predicted DNA-binding transcriptional regulator AlpA